MDVIICPCPWYRLLEQRSSNKTVFGEATWFTDKQLLLRYNLQCHIKQIQIICENDMQNHFQIKIVSYSLREITEPRQINSSNDHAMQMDYHLPWGGI